MKLILLIILLIIVIYLYNQTLIETKKENMDPIIYCNKNCGKYNIDKTSTNISGCLSCDSCGVCTLPNNNQICMNGNKDGAYFNDDCSGSNWQYGLTTSNSNIPINYDYESQLINIGQTNNLPSQATNVSYEIQRTTPISKIRHNETTLALANLLDKINSTNRDSSISEDNIQQLQEILNKLKSSVS